jgi:hypothetical protein
VTFAVCGSHLPYLIRVIKHDLYVKVITEYPVNCLLQGGGWTVVP